MEKVKRLLRVDSDEDTGHLHNKVLLISPESVEIKSQPKININLSREALDEQVAVQRER